MLDNFLPLYHYSEVKNEIFDGKITEEKIKKRKNELEIQIKDLKQQIKDKEQRIEELDNSKNLKRYHRAFRFVKIHLFAVSAVIVGIFYVLFRCGIGSPQDFWGYFPFCFFIHLSQ